MFQSLRRGFRVAMEELNQSLRHKKKTLGMLLIPLVFIFLLTLGFGDFFEEGLFIESFSVAVVNEDQHPMAFLLMDQIREDEGLQELIEIVEAKDAVAAERKVQSEEAFAGVVIPEDFVGSLERGKSRELILYSSPRDPFKSQVLKGIMESFMYSVSAGQSGVNAVWDYYREQEMTLEERREKIDPVIRDITFRALNARESVLTEEQVEGINTMGSGIYYLHSVVFSLLLFMALFLGKNLIEERNLRIFDRIPFSGTGIGEYYWGKILGNSLRMVLYGGGLLAFGQVIFVGGVEGSLWVSIAYLTLWVLLITSMVGLLSLIIPDRSLFFTVGNFVIFMLILLGGGLIPYYYLPYGLDRIAGFLPHFHYLTGIRRIMLGDYGSMVPEMGIMVVAGVVFLSLGCWKIKGWAGDKA